MPSNSRRAFDDAGREIGSVAVRLARAWSTLDRERRLACSGALLLLLSMFLPWYQQNAVVGSGVAQPLVSRNLNAFAIFSFVEAAILLVALAILLLLFARAERRRLSLPLGDGTLILAGGIWTGLLLLYRLFDKPGIAARNVAANVGIQWGIFFALLAAGILIYAGSRMRLPGPPPRLGTRPGPPAGSGTAPQEWESFEGEARVRSPRPTRSERQPTVLLARNPGIERERTVRLARKRERPARHDGEQQLSFEDDMSGTQTRRSPPPR